MYRSCSVLLFATTLLLTSVAVAQEAPTLTIDLTQAKAKVSPQLYGLMTEEINYSYDGGLHAELVRNRTFQDRGKIPPNWFLYEWGNADVAELRQVRDFMVDFGLTDDGELAHRLLHPSFGVDKTYRAAIAGRLSSDDVRRLLAGLVMNDGRAAGTLTFCARGHTS